MVLALRNITAFEDGDVEAIAVEVSERYPSAWHPDPSHGAPGFYTMALHTRQRPSLGELPHSRLVFGPIMQNRRRVPKLASPGRP